LPFAEDVAPDGAWEHVCYEFAPDGATLMFRGLGQHLADFDRRAPFGFAFVGALHEGEDFDGFVGRNGGDAGFEEFHDLDDERYVAVEGTSGDFAFFAFGKAVEFFVFAVNAFCAVFPGANDFDFAVSGRAALDGFAARSENGEHGFDAVDAIPEEIGMVFFDLAGAVSLDIIDLADGTVMDSLSIFRKTERRRTEDWNFGFFGEAKNFDDIRERTGHRFIDEDGFAGFEDGFDLLEVRTAVNTFEENSIDILAELVDGVVKLDTVFFFQRFCVIFDTISAFRNVRAAALEGGDDFSAGDVVFGVGVVEVFGESGDVRGVAANNPDAEIGGEETRVKSEHSIHEYVCGNGSKVHAN